MPVGSYCRRKVCLALPDETLEVAAQRMETEGVGLLVVVDEGRPSGVLTDRDVALHVLAPDGPLVGDAMGPKPWTVRTDAPLSDAVALMSRHGVRRLPVVDADGHSLGIIAADDVVRLLAAEISDLAGVAEVQLSSELRREEGRAQRQARERSVDHYLRPVVAVPPDATVRTAVEQMHHHATGSVLVVGAAGSPEGIVTDRDVALRVVAKGLDAAHTSVSSIMTAPVTACDASEPIEAVVEQMRARRVRRMPILRAGRPAGIVTYDDLLNALGNELAALAHAAARQVRREQRRTRLAEARAEVGRGLRQTATRLGTLSGQGVKALRRGVGSLRGRHHA